LTTGSVGIVKYHHERRKLKHYKFADGFPQLSSISVNSTDDYFMTSDVLKLKIFKNVYYQKRPARKTVVCNFFFHARTLVF
jgi:hypothetical protein